MKPQFYIILNNIREAPKQNKELDRYRSLGNVISYYQIHVTYNSE